MSDQTMAEDDWSSALSEQADATKADSQGLHQQEGLGQGMHGLQDEDSRISKDVFNDIRKENLSPDTKTDIEFILDIPVQITVELGRTKISIKNLIQLTQGSVIELNGLAGEPLDVLVNGCLIAHGEVVVVNDKFGIRLIDIANPAERLQRINK
jgi:flagellar motor switch protein FliN